MSSEPNSSGSNEEFRQPDLTSLGDDSRELLEEVLNETLAAANPDEMSAEEIAALKKVVQAHHGQPLDVDTTIAELVESMVRHRFGHLSQSDQFWRTMLTWIARTLWDDPDSRHRIELLWQGLSEN